MLEEVFNCENNRQRSYWDIYMAIYLLRFQGKSKKRFRQINRILDDPQLKLVLEGVSASLHFRFIRRLTGLTQCCPEHGVTEIYGESSAAHGQWSQQRWHPALCTLPMSPDYTVLWGSSSFLTCCHFLHSLHWFVLPPSSCSHLLSFSTLTHVKELVWW